MLEFVHVLIVLHQPLQQKTRQRELTFYIVKLLSHFSSLVQLIVAA